MIKFDELKPYVQKFILGEYETEGRHKSKITLIVHGNGVSEIWAGLGTGNPHGLQNYLKEFRTPYFEYKNCTKWSTPQEAVAMFNEWIKIKESNFKAR